MIVSFRDTAFGLLNQTYMKRFEAALYPYLKSQLEDFTDLASASVSNEGSEMAHLEGLLVEAGIAVFENHPLEANSIRELLGEIRRESTMRGWQPLFDAAIELSIQNSVRRDDLTAASYFLSLTRDDLIIKKWTALLALYRGEGQTHDSLQILHWVREHAQATGEWELARDCDLHQALATRDQSLVLKLFFGTPYPEFRERLIEAAATWMDILPSDYDYAPKGLAARSFDVTAGREAQRASLRRGKNMHRLLTRLASDFYRPFLFAEADAQKYSLLAHRLRNWFEDYEIPLGVQILDGSVRLLWRGPYALRVAQQMTDLITADKDQHQVDALVSSFKEKSFTSREAAAQLGISVRSTVHILAIAIEQKKLVRSGNGRSTLYAVAEIPAAARSDRQLAG
jgi:hypothetical protein